MEQKDRELFRKILFDAVAIVVLALLLMPLHSWVYDTPFLNYSENTQTSASDLAYAIQREQVAAQPSSEISIVDISGISGSDTRGVIAALLDTIYQMQPRRIGVDIMFPAPSHFSVYDSLLVATVERIADKTVFICELDSYSPRQNQFLSCSHSFYQSVKGISEGYSNLMQDGDNKPISQYSLRQMAVDSTVVYSFPAQMVIDYLDESDFADNTPIIRFEPTDFPCMSHNQLDADSIRDRFVLVGDMRAQSDSHNTPLGFMQGLEIHAYTMQTMLEHNPIRHTNVLLLFVIAIIIGFLYTLFVVFVDKKLAVDPTNMMKFILQQGLLTMGVTYVLNLILEYIAYVSFTVFETNFGLHAMLPSIIKLIAFTKVVYCIVLPMLSKRFGWRWLRLSNYSGFSNPDDKNKN